MTQPAGYVAPDDCPLPDLYSGSLILGHGSTFACPHYSWTVRHQRDWRGNTLANWAIADAAPSQLSISLGLQLPAVLAKP